MPGGGEADVISARRKRRGDRQCFIGGIASGGAGGICGLCRLERGRGYADHRTSLEVARRGFALTACVPALSILKMHASGGEPGCVGRDKGGVPCQLRGQPEEVAQAIAWLLSEKASYVTGSFLELAGGK